MSEIINFLKQHKNAILATIVEILIWYLLIIMYLIQSQSPIVQSDIITFLVMFTSIRLCTYIYVLLVVIIN